MLLPSFQVKAPCKRGSFNEDQTTAPCRLACLTICVCVTVLTFAWKYIYYNALTPEVTPSVLNKATCEVRHSYTERIQNLVSTLLSLKKYKAKAQLQNVFVVTAEDSKLKFVDMTHILQYTLNNLSKINQSPFGPVAPNFL